MPNEKDPWPDVLLAAVGLAGKDISEPILGAHFRQLVAQAASAKGVAFPPASEPGLRLGELVRRYPSIVVSLSRPGQDMLLAPASRPELLTQKQKQESPTGIRSDLFVAFTRIGPSRQPWYDPEQDTVVWLEAAPETDRLVPIPSPALGDEVAIRRAFAEQIDDERVQQLLLEALAATKPLPAFTAFVRAENLQRRWHLFRTGALIERIRKWAQQFGLPWQESWLTSSESRANSSAPGKHASMIDADSQQRFLQGVLRLSAEEMARISIPLDVVLKLLR